MKKRWISILLCAALALSLTSVPAYAVEEAEAGPAVEIWETVGGEDTQEKDAPETEPGGGEETDSADETDSPTEETEAPTEETEDPKKEAEAPPEEAEDPAGKPETPAKDPEDPVDAPPAPEQVQPEEVAVSLTSGRADDLAPLLEGELDVDWSRTAESDVLIEGPFDYSAGNTSHVPTSGALDRVFGEEKALSDLIADSHDNPVWDAHTDGQVYGGLLSQRPNAPQNPGATWRNHAGNQGGVSLRRIQGAFTVPGDCSVLDSTIRLVSAAQNRYEDDPAMSEINDGKVVAVNDNIYVFVYREGEDVNEENYMDFLAFYGGHNIPGQFGGLTNATGAQTGNKRLTAVADGWIIYSQIDNLGAPLANRYGPNAMAGETYIIDMFLEDNSKGSGGGMDQVVLEFAQADPKEAPVFVEYYRGGVSDDTLLGRETYKGQTIGRTWTEGKVDLNLYKAQAGEGYKNGRIVTGMPLTVTGDPAQNVIRVVYPEPDMVSLTVEHVYSSGYNYVMNPGGEPETTIITEQYFTQAKGSVTIPLRTEGPGDLSYEYQGVDGNPNPKKYPELFPTADQDQGRVSVTLTDRKEHCVRVFYFHTESVPYQVEHRYYTKTAAGQDFVLTGSVTAPGGELFLRDEVDVADIALEETFESTAYTFYDADCGETFQMSWDLVEAYAKNQENIPTLVLNYRRDVSTTSVTVWHYYGGNASPIGDPANGTGAMTLSRDSMAVTADYVNGFAAPKDNYKYVSYKIDVSNDDRQWEPTIYELEGHLDLTGAMAVNIHLVYDPYYTVIITGDAHSTVSGGGEYREGVNVDTAFAAEQGWHIASVTVDGVAYSPEEIAAANGAVSFPAIDRHHEVAVTTAQDESGGGNNDNNNNNNSGGQDNDRDDRPRPTPTPVPTPEVTPGPEPEPEVEIVDQDIPLADLPAPEETGEVTVTDGDVPLADQPQPETTETTDISDEVIVVDERIPLGDLPQTGTAAPARALGLMALAASLAAAGAAVCLGRKRDDEEA